MRENVYKFRLIVINLQGYKRKTKRLTTQQKTGQKALKGKSLKGHIQMVKELKKTRSVPCVLRKICKTKATPARPAVTGSQ